MAIPIKYNFRNLWVRRVSTGMTLAVIALVVAVFLWVLALGTGVDRTLSTNASTRNVITVRTGAQSEMQSVVSRESADLIRALPGIERNARGEPLVSPELVVLVNLPRRDAKRTNVQVRGVGPMGLEMRPQVRLVEGQAFRPGTNEAIVSRALQTRFANTQIGDTIRQGTYQWKVSGIFEADGSPWESEIWTDVSDLQLQARRPLYSAVLVRTTDPEAARRYAETVKGDQRLKFDGKTEKKYYEEQMVTGAPIKVLAVLVGLFTAVGAAFGAMNTMYAQVTARTREIGTLRAIGFSRLSVLVSFVLEAVMLCLIGGILGTALAFLLFNVVMSAQTGTMNFRTFSEIIFNFRLTPALVLTGMFFALLVGLFGGFFPAYRAARLKIVNALREV